MYQVYPDLGYYHYIFKIKRIGNLSLLLYSSNVTQGGKRLIKEALSVLLYIEIEPKLWIIQGGGGSWDEAAGPSSI